jgi:hypothetical protein
MLIQELPCLDSNIAGQVLLIEFCNKIGPTWSLDCPLPILHHSGLMPANRTTLARSSISSAMMG